MAGPSELEVVALGAFAGLTIYLGMPLARARGLGPRTRAAFSAFACGILAFIFFDVLANATGLIDARLAAGDRAAWAADAAILLTGFVVGVISLVVVEAIFRRRGATEAELQGEPIGERGSLAPLTLATMIATGIGLHNFSEGLAIGASYASGALGLGAVLVIGFAIHNSTEGFGILGPGMMAGTRFSTMRLLGLGLLGGGPTFLGTIFGSLVSSDPLSILFYGLAAGAILYVVLTMARPLLAQATRDIAFVALAIGFTAGYLTDLVVAYGGG